MLGRSTFLLTIVALSGWFAAAATRGPATPTSVRIAEPAPPHLVVGNEACEKCHAAETGVWKRTPHAQTFETLHRKPEARQIAQRLGLRSIKHDGRCTGCHYTQQSSASVDASFASGHGPEVVAGVSCESCHGAAKGWIELHADFGGPTVTAAHESPAHRVERLRRSVAAGMRNPQNVFAMAQSCLRCHTTPDEELVNVGGHSVGSPEFEFVSWSQGSVRHNFGGGQSGASVAASNQVRSPSHLRLMFVCGMVAELEAGLRATALATEKATYGLQAAARTDRTAKRLQSVAAKIDCQTLQEILDVYASVRLKLNHRGPLTAAADEVASLGYRLADEENGENWAVLDRFIPTPPQYR